MWNRQLANTAQTLKTKKHKKEITLEIHGLLKINLVRFKMIRKMNDHIENIDLIVEFKNKIPLEFSEVFKNFLSYFS